MAQPSPLPLALGHEGIGVDNHKNEMLGSGGGSVFCPLTRLFGLKFVLFTLALAFSLPPTPAVLLALLRYYSRHLRQS